MEQWKTDADKRPVKPDGGWPWAAPEDIHGKRVRSGVTGQRLLCEPLPACKTDSGIQPDDAEVTAWIPWQFYQLLQGTCVAVWQFQRWQAYETAGRPGRGHLKGKSRDIREIPWDITGQIQHHPLRNERVLTAPWRTWHKRFWSFHGRVQQGIGKLQGKRGHCHGW